MCYSCDKSDFQQIFKSNIKYWGSMLVMILKQRIYIFIMFLFLSINIYKLN